MSKPFLTKWPFLFKIRLILGLILLILVIIFLYFKVVPFGQISYQKSWPEFLHSGKGFVYNFSPPERINLQNDDSAKIIGDPIYFSLFTPRTFDRAKLTIKYREKLSSQTPIIEAGVLVDKLVWRYDLQPLENQIIDELRFNWRRIEEQGVMLLQLASDYNSLTELAEDLERGLLKNCPGGPTSCLAVYNYQPDFQYRLTDQRRAEPVIIDKPLRGAHQFYLYIKDEPLRLDFEFVDLNQDQGEDPITINLYSGDQILTSQFLFDENLRPTSGEVEEKNLYLEEKKLPQGVYKIEVKVSNDIVIRKITSSVNRLSFINKIWPVSTPGNLTLFTDTNYLQVKALNPVSLQTIKFGGEDFELNETYQQFDFETTSPAKVKEIKFLKDDLILENSGVFAWTKEGLFNPGFKKVDRHFIPDETIRYIIARYEPPLDNGGIKKATAEFNLKGVYREKGKYSFIISVPGLKAEDKIDDYLEIKEIKIELTGRTLWQKIFN